MRLVITIEEKACKCKYYVHVQYAVQERDWKICDLECNVTLCSRSDSEDSNLSILSGMTMTVK